MKRFFFTLWTFPLPQTRAKTKKQNGQVTHAKIPCNTYAHQRAHGWNKSKTSRRKKMSNGQKSIKFTHSLCFYQAVAKTLQQQPDVGNGQGYEQQQDGSGIMQLVPFAVCPFGWEEAVLPGQQPPGPHSYTMCCCVECAHTRTSRAGKSASHRAGSEARCKRASNRAYNKPVRMFNMCDLSSRKMSH